MHSWLLCAISIHLYASSKKRQEDAQPANLTQTRLSIDLLSRALPSLPHFRGGSGNQAQGLRCSMVLHRAPGVVSTSIRCIQAGDLVVVYERFDSMKSVYVNPRESYGNRYGNFKLKVALRSWFESDSRCCDNSCRCSAGLDRETLW